jgi:methionine-gamma-lyase
MNKANWKIDTKIIHECLTPDEKTRAIVPSITPAVAYSFSTAEEAASVVAGMEEGIYYGRYGNPTVRKLEEKIASLEYGEAALALSSGMAAISTALLSCLKTGDHVLVTKDVYGGTYSFLTTLAERIGIQFDFVDCTNPNNILEGMLSNTKAIYIETPSNPNLTILDIEQIAKVSKKMGVPLIVDNTFMSPILQNPLLLGADIVVHSGTKYINGHGDVLCGFIVSDANRIDMMRKKIMGDLGQNLNAYEAFLVIRGLKTISLRVEKHCSNARKVAEFLASHPMIEKVYYPGLKCHPGHEIAIKQMRDMGGIVSFEVKGGLDQGKLFINSLELAMISFSLGDPETLIQHPASMTHAQIPKEERAKYGITDGLMRLSVGLEDSQDIINDLEQALKKVDIRMSV